MSRPRKLTMNTFIKKTIIIALACCMILCSSLVSFADSFEAPAMEFSGETIQIYTPEDLFAMADNPSGIYELMNDIDLDDYDWKPFAFSGKFIGNNYRIMNVHISQYSDETRTVYDCNHKPYESHFVGFFGLLENAWVEQLVLLSTDFSVDCDDECIFAGGIAGYMYDSYVFGCSVFGRSYLSTGGKCFGIGGLAGYGGESTIFGCTADVTLTCIDEDLTYKDEQFMGGAYALGYIDLRSVTVDITGYDADHGYVHDGGLIGSYYKYNGDYGHGTVSNCSVKGSITFFEDNKNRRAYCSAYIGEVMNWSLSMDYNTESFTRNEIFDYTAELGPHWDCSNPQMEDSVTEAAYGVIGCTTHTCKTCGYSFSDNYELQRIPAESASIELEYSDGTLAGSEGAADIKASNESRKLYLGDSAKIHVSFEPYNASPMDVKLVSSNSDIISVSDYALAFAQGQPSTCDAELRILGSGPVTIKVLVDGEEKDAIIITAYSHADYIKDTYGIYILAGAVLVVVIVIVLIAIASGKKTRGKHAR